ncbi:MAG: FtsX-like permease family protein, partial [Longimicrobiales bacterium]|nr:FtsX-like permease family protein [Longimicrobiales bacterium]
DGLQALQSRDPGFDPDGVATVQLFADRTRYPDDVALWDLHRRVLEEVRALPGVVAAGMGEEVPVRGLDGCTVQAFEDRTVYERMDDAGLTTCAAQIRVTPGYLEALGVPIEVGRGLEPGDNDDPSRAAVVVSRAFADRFWPGEDPIGKGIGPSGRSMEPYYRVVGVAGNVAQRAEEGAPPLTQSAMAVYYPGVYTPPTEGRWGGWWPGAMELVIRTEGIDAASILPAVRRTVSEIDPEIPLAEAGLLADSLDEAMAGASFLSYLMMVAALAALLLAAVGLYGVVSWVVSKRTREIGMRLAIGAEPSQVVRVVVGRTMGLAALGLIVGLPVAVLTSRVGRSVLVGVEPTAPAAYVAAAGVVAVVSALAAWVPARRAARIDPAESLRAE